MKNTFDAIEAAAKFKQIGIVDRNEGVAAKEIKEAVAQLSEEKKVNKLD